MTSLKGKTVVFTGFRDQGLQAKINAKGGRVVSAVSGTIDFLVASGSKLAAESAKVKKARSLGATVMGRDQFVAEFFTPSRPEKCWLTHDNGGRPFKVCCNTQRFWVSMPKDDGADDLVYDKLVIAPTKYGKVFVGKCPDHGKAFDGNSMLFELAPHTYMFVGDAVYTFKTPDTITKYVSRVGNSDVPYPFAVGAQNTYLMVEKTSMPNAMRTRDDPYEQLYACEGECSCGTRPGRCIIKPACTRKCNKQMDEFKRQHRMRTRTLQGRA